MAIVNPVSQLVDGAVKIGQGDPEARIEVKTKDEIGRLGIAFYEMAAALSDKEVQLREIFHSVGTESRGANSCPATGDWRAQTSGGEILRRNHELTVLYTIRRATAQSLDLRQVLTDSVKVTLEALRIEGGVIMLIDPDGQTMTMHAQHGLSEEFARNLEHIKIGEGLAGKAVSEKQPVIFDLSEYPTERLAPLWS